MRCWLRARPRRGGSMMSTFAGSPRPAPASSANASCALRARNFTSTPGPAAASPSPAETSSPGKTRRAFAQKGPAQFGFTSVLSSETLPDSRREEAACARLRPMTPTPPQSSSNRNGCSSVSSDGACRCRAAFISLRIRSKTTRFDCWKLAGPKEKARPSSSSMTSEERLASSAPPGTGRTCCHASGRLEWIAFRRAASGSRQCTQMECHRRPRTRPASPPAGQSISISFASSGAGRPRGPFQMSTSWTRPEDLSMVTSTNRRAPSISRHDARAAWLKGLTMPRNVSKVSCSSRTAAMMSGWFAAQPCAGTTSQEPLRNRPMTEAPSAPAGPTAIFPLVLYPLGLPAR
mmetsp:Transcript_15152/g.44296  ORF Transcript_15152/g.44296 Transcript_15152/m.44296 type:complete len:348 (-) Transcript_15152:206-1249(-)